MKLVLLLALFSHDGHHHPPDMRIWKDADGLFELEAVFLSAKDGKVTLKKHDGNVVTLPLAKFSSADRKFVNDKLAAIEAVNGSLRANDLASVRARSFAAFPNLVKTRSDKEHLFIESRGFPDHPMMIGITAWQQQVPLPQSYLGGNAWRIPLQPKMATEPISAKHGLFRGAIAIAANGVPIFNPIKNDGRTDTFLVGELDEYGGHCGRADDYHYHIAPVHLEKIVGKGNPIGYALDGFPLYGYTDSQGQVPHDLDEFNGRMEKDGYRYYSTRNYPYVNGGLRGVITVREGQVDPQPRANPVRPAGEPLRGAKITAFERDDSLKKYTVRYSLRGKEKEIEYSLADNGAVNFVFEDGSKASFQSRQDDERQAERKKNKKEGTPPGRKKENGGKRREDDRSSNDDSSLSAAVTLNPKRSGKMMLSSPSVRDGGALPMEFTGDGAGSTLPLAWRGAPEETKSFALVMDHQARDGMKCYWILYDIPAKTTSLPKDVKDIGRLGVTWKPGESYVPPHSKGPGKKTYTFTLFALSRSPSFSSDANVTRDALLNTIKGSILDSAELKVSYERMESSEEKAERANSKENRRPRTSGDQQ